jgi:DHA1 family bicyclomycin/chloramphenicol resistance-like MFS transporter
LVRDIFPKNKTAQAFSLLTLVIAVSPMVAPTVGGYVTSLFGWHYIFITLAAITTVIALTAYFYLPTGKGPDTSMSLSPASVARGYYTVLSHPQFLTYSLAGGLATAAPFAYIAGSAEVFINQYKVSEQEYGWIFAIIAFGMVGSTQFNHLLLRRFTSQQIIKGALVYQMIIGAILVIGTYYHWYHLHEFVGITFLLFMGQGLISPNTSALSLAPFSRHAGSASALLGSWRMGAGGIISASVSVLHNGTALPMVCAMVACSYLSMGILVVGGKAIQYRASRKSVEEQSSVLV